MFNFLKKKKIQADFCAALDGMRETSKITSDLAYEFKKLAIECKRWQKEQEKSKEFRDKIMQK